MSVLHHNPARGTLLTIIGYLQGFQVSGTTLILNQEGHCEVIFGNTKDCSFSKYKHLFDSKEGKSLNTDEETLRQLQQLGYVGQE